MKDDLPRWMCLGRFGRLNPGLIDCGSIATTVAEPSTCDVSIASILRAKRQIESLGGGSPVRIVIDKHLGWKSFQCRFPKSKKRRIRRKWFKQARNWRAIQEPVAYLANLPNLWGRTDRMLILNEPAKFSMCLDPEFANSRDVEIKEGER